MKKRTHLRKSLFLLLLTILGCSKDSPENPAAPTTITYTESSEDFPNPERGFYQYSETHSGSYSPLNAATVAGYRSPKTASGAKYAVVSTLVFRYFVLDDAKAGPLSSSFINSLKNDFTAARTAGAKLILRFTYTVDPTPGECPEAFICPPYGDAPKAIVINQIGQLKPVFTDNADVIACLQLGFIGMWGENYYTDYFGDPSGNAGQGKLLDENWKDRSDVLQAMLDATPPEIMVQVRIPQFKQRFVYGVNAPVTSAALTEEEAFSGSDKARISFHNDCFQASSDDYGTYEDYGNSTTPRMSANTALRSYFAADSKYGPVGGETCSDEFSPQNDCAPTGRAEEQMAILHYSFLNTDYNNSVNNDWVDGGCMDNIKKNLGYRFVLKSGTFPSSVKAGEMLSVSLSLENRGYASPYKPRPVQLILKNETTGETITKTFTTDIRRWYSGPVTLEESFSIPAVAGDWKLFLNFPDQAASLNTRPEYSIRLANENIWDEATGWNDLGAAVSVK